MKTALTDRKLRSLKAAPESERYWVMDTIERQFGVRVDDEANKVFYLNGTRFPGKPQPLKRAIGPYPSTTLAEGRAKAKTWKQLVAKGVDPRDAERQEQDAAARAKANTVAAVLADFAKDRLSTQRKGRDAERTLRRHLARWMPRPIVSITTREGRDLIKAKKATPYEASNLLANMKLLFSYAVDEDCYGIDVNPFASLKASKLIGEKAARDRVLGDDELHALTQTVSELSYPYGPAYRVLILTALRLNEAVRASWSEVDLKKRTWVVPAARMKGKNGRARPHAVPITDELLAILNELPRFKDNPYLFTTNGRTPVAIGNKIKRRIDERMLTLLREFAVARGQDPAKVTLPRWTNHDIRRSVRSQLSRIKTISEETREAVLAHVRPGIKSVYDHHDYLDEKREALEAWAARLRGIVEPADDDNVVQLRTGA